MRTPRLFARLALGAICATALTVVTGPGTASACSCADVTLTDYAEDIAVAFVGTQIDRSVDNSSSQNGATLTFDVERVYLGDVTTPFTVRTAAEDASCGVDYTDAGSVAVTARRFDGEFNVGLCDQPTVDELTAAFGVGVDPQPAPPPDDSWGSNAVVRAALIVLLATVVIAGAAVIARNRRSS